MRLAKDAAAACEAKPGPGAIDYGELPRLLGYAVKRAQIAIYEDFTRVLGGLELRPAEFSALMLLGHNPGLRQRALGEALGIQPPNLVGLMNRLAARGLVERRPHPLDSRSVALSLSASGTALLARARTRVAKQDRAVARHLSDAEYRHLIALLQAIPAAT